MNGDSAAVETLCVPTVQPISVPRNALVPSPPNYYLDSGDLSIQHTAVAARGSVPQAKSYISPL